MSNSFPLCEVRPHNGAPALLLDGEPVFPLLLMTAPDALAKLKTITPHRLRFAPVEKRLRRSAAAAGSPRSGAGVLRWGKTIRNIAPATWTDIRTAQTLARDASEVTVEMAKGQSLIFALTEH